MPLTSLNFTNFTQAIHVEDWSMRRDNLQIHIRKVLAAYSSGWLLNYKVTYEFDTLRLK